MNIDYTRYTDIPELTESVPSSSIDIKSLGYILQSLDNTLSKTKLSLSVFDALKITKTVSSSNEFGAKKAALGYNNALIINTLNKFTIGSETYKRGDIIYRDNNGDYHTISSQTAGYYVPTSYTEGKLTFKYSTGVPNNTEDISGFKVKWDPGVYKQFVTVKSNEKASISFKFGEIPETAQIIYPTVKVYYYSSSENKYVECGVNYTISKNESNFTVEAADELPFNTIWVVK